ncbi:ABC transporter ATP-binding protein [Sagittula sp. S175]|uniref:ABC transporter ATP-binding protein n=1 Tax=Sagittula sp. S175 TaxID=3415129 RepID=UPI003C7D5A1F
MSDLPNDPTAPKALSSAEALSYGKRLLREVVPQRWKLILLTLLSIIGVAGFTGALANSTKLIVDDVFGAGNQGAALRVALIIVGVAVGKSFFQYITEVLKVMLMRSVAVVYQKRLFANVIRQELGYFNAQHSSVQMVMVQMLGQSTGVMVSDVCNRLVVEVLTVAALFTVMLLQDPLLTLICSLIVPLILWLVSALSKRIREIASADAGLAAQFFSVGVEVLRGIKTVKSFQMERKSVARFNASMEALEERGLQFARITASTIPIMEFLGGVVIGAFVIFASWQIATTDRTAGELTAFITAFLMAYQPAERLSAVWVEVQKSLVFVRQMYNLLDRAPLEKPYGDKVLDEVQPSVHLQDVSFSYGGDAPALRNVTLDIAAGERIAVVGPSGAGKSTLIDILQRFYDPQEGTVSIGGIDLRDVSRESLHASIALISQDVFLFDGTLAENIAHGRPGATRAELEAAARIAQLDSLIARMPEGLDSQIGPNGNALSGGQRQRLSIARGVAKRAKVYIFDEVTSALDGANERAVMSALVSELKGATLIFVTHRASTFDYVDRVAVLSEGHLAGFDRPEALSQDNAAYQALFHEPDPD